MKEEQYLRQNYQQFVWLKTETIYELLIICRGNYYEE